MTDEQLEYQLGTTTLNLWIDRITTEGQEEKFRNDWAGCRDTCLIGTLCYDPDAFEQGLARYATFHDEDCPNRGWRVVFNEQGVQRVQGGDGVRQRAEAAGLFGDDQA